MINVVLVLLSMFSSLNVAASELSLSSSCYKVKKFRVGGPQCHYKVIDGVKQYPDGKIRFFCGILSSKDKNILALTAEALKQQLSAGPSQISISKMEDPFQIHADQALGIKNVGGNDCYWQIPTAEDGVPVDAHILFPSSLCDDQIVLPSYQHRDIIRHIKEKSLELSLDNIQSIAVAIGLAQSIFHRAPLLVIDLKKIGDYLQAQQKLTISEEDAEANRY